MNNTMITLPGYQVHENLYQSIHTLVYRGTRNSDHQPVILKTLRNEYPNFNELVQFRHQYTIAKNLDFPGIIQTYDLEAYGNGYILIIEDFGGISLSEFNQGKPLNIQSFLPIAIQLSDILHGLYQNRVIHKDIKPANILIHPETKQVKLIDFSISSLLPRETQDIQNPNILEGTLAYISPEQTGRMNRGIDYRTDFYSLGITFYELITGKLPFQSDDPMELVHCHLAKTALPIHEIDASIPLVLSNIIAKLIAKNAEERYQSALGLKQDLQQCLTQWKETRTISEFIIAQQDRSDRFTIPEKLYGREREVAELLAAFDRVANPAESSPSQGSEILLVAGFSGIGKTAVINEVHKPIVRQRGYFIKGKFDQFNRNIPLSAFVQVFRNLIHQLLSESDAQLMDWKTKILNAVGENGQVLIDVIPELEQMIGSQPPVTELSGSTAQNRFNLLFQRFIQVFTTKEHPLVIFLDDLQWADLASLNLLKSLITESKTGYLLILGAYRDHEVFPAHPLMLTLDEIEKTKANIQTITLEPLTNPMVNQLVADTLICCEELAQPLTDLIFQKTQGNPFFITHFLKSLYEDHYISFNLDYCFWECDIAKIKTLSITDDIVEFMAAQLQKLPEATQDLLKLAACIGNQFDLNTLAIVTQKTPTDVAHDLWNALQEELILPLSKTYKFFQETTISKIPNNDDRTASYQFLHDRIQQAAYSLIPQSEKGVVHQTIGQLLLKTGSEEECHERIFEIANHLNQGIHLITDPLEQQELAEINLRAGRKAKAATAYQAALNYLELSIDLLSEHCWQQQYDLTLTIYTELANNAYLVGDFRQMEKRLTIAFQQTKSLLDRVPLYEIQIQAFVAQNQLQEAIQFGLTTLKQLGIDFLQQPTPEDFGRELAHINASLADRSVKDLIHLPVMTEPRLLAVMGVLFRLAGVVILGAPHLMPFIFFKMVSLSIQAGNTVFSAPGYVTYGMILCSTVGDIETGYAFGQLALDLLDQLPSRSVQAKTLSRFHGGVRHWKESWHSLLSDLQTGYQLGLETGDLETTAIFAQLYGYISYFSGVELSHLAQVMADYSHAIEQLHQPSFLRWNQTYRQHVLNLLGESENPCQLIGEAYNETIDLPQQYAVKDAHGIAIAHLFKAISCYFFYNYEEAIRNLDKIPQFGRAIGSFITGNMFYFYDSLARLAWFPHVSSQEQDIWLNKVVANQEKMQKFSDFAPMNWSHKRHLVEAQYQQILGNRLEAIENYDQAIAGAKEYQYIQEEALANELAAKFYLDWGKEKVASAYMQDAYYCYAKWGAKAKINDLEKRYPNLLKPILQPPENNLNSIETLATITAPYLSIHTPTTTQSSSTSSRCINTVLDFAAVVKASQAISGTLQLDELLHQLTQIILQNSGGDYCALVLPNQIGKWQLEAVATSEKTELCSEPLEDHPNLPVQLIHYVKKTQEIVVIDDLKTDLPVLDQYLIQQQPQSISCLPILNQGEVLGILYLQNQSTPHIFTGSRVFILNLLCTQAAICLKNVQLYQKEQQIQRKLTTLFGNLPGMAYSCSNDEDWTMFFVSEGCFNLTGYRAKELINSHSISYAQLVHPDDTDWIYQQVEEALRLHQSFKFSYRIYTKQGELKWVWEQGCGVFDENGEVLALEGFVADITEQKRAEATAIEKSKELEKALEELQNTQLQLVQNEKMASLGGLVSGIAHEINNPLGFLNGSINNTKEYIQDLLHHLKLYQQSYPEVVQPVQDHREEIDLEFLREDLPKLLNAMEGATNRMKSISTSLRTFSRSDTEQKVRANLHEGLESTLLLLKYRLKANEYRPTIKLMKNYGELPPIDCYPGQLNQVFMNIVANAIDMFDETAKHQSRTDFKIRITTAFLTEQKVIEVRIADNGVGIPDPIKMRIFEHLFTTKAVGKGTGLGLAITRQIITQKHGGTITVESELDQGTEFCLRLPISSSPILSKSGTLKSGHQKQVTPTSIE